MKLFSVKLMQGEYEVVVAVVADSAEMAGERARKMLSGATGAVSIHEWPNGAFVAYTAPILPPPSKP